MFVGRLTSLATSNALAVLFAQLTLVSLVGRNLYGGGGGANGPDYGNGNKGEGAQGADGEE